MKRIAKRRDHQLGLVKQTLANLSIHQLGQMHGGSCTTGSCSLVV